MQESTTKRKGTTMKLNYTSAFKALSYFVDAHNERCEKSTDKIKSAAIHAAKEMIRIYGAFLLKAEDINSASPAIAELWPPLRTNNEQLATLCKCSTRSIQRYIIRLYAAGFIVKKVFHGSNASYELWINHKILFPADQIDQATVEQSTSADAENMPESKQPASISTNCPDTDSTGYNNIIIHVDNVDNSSIGSTTDEIADHVAGYSVAGHSEKADGVRVDFREPESGREKITDGGGGGPTTPAHTASLNFYASMLWTLARNTLYQDNFVTGEHEAIARRHLLKYYAGVSEEKLPRVHEIYAERIALVCKYIKRDPENRYVQLPHTYFDLSNESGFKGTKSWWQKQNERKKEVEKQLILHAQVRRYLSNLQKDTAKQKPVMELFRSCEQRIGKLNEPLLLAQFHATILQPATYSQIYSGKQINNNQIIKIKTYDSKSKPLKKNYR
jgi:hypothetical protein